MKKIKIKTAEECKSSSIHPSYALEKYALSQFKLSPHIPPDPAAPF